MSSESVVYQSQIPVSRSFAWDCYVRPGMFQRLTPPWQQLRSVETQGSVRPGDRRVFDVMLGPIPIRWVAVHGDYEEGYLFSDRQSHGPFKTWRHRHRFLTEGEADCRIRDEIEFELPASTLSHRFGLGIARTELHRMFRYRHAVTFFDFVEHANWKDRPRRAVRITGGPEAVVQQLAAFLDIGGHDVSVTNQSTSADIVHVSGDYSSGLRAEITSVEPPAIHRIALQTARIIGPESPLIGLARACQFFDVRGTEVGDRRIAWSTIDDFIVAIHRLLLDRQPERESFLCHPTRPVFASLVDASGGGSHRTTALSIPEPLAERVRDELSKSSECADQETIAPSRYRSIFDAVGTLTGRS